MKKTLKGFLAGMVTAALVVAPIFSYAEGGQNIEAFFNRVKLVVNGQPSASETLLYNGTTYVPLRAVTENLGATVNYDAATKTASINMPNTSAAVEQTKPAAPVWTSGRYSLKVTETSSPEDPKTLVITDATNEGFNFQLLDEKGSAKLSGKVTVSGNTATYNATELDVLRFTASGDTVTIDEAKGLQIPSGKAVYVKEASEVRPSMIVNSWYDGKFILQPTSATDPDDPVTLIVSNATDVAFDFKLLDAEDKTVAEGHASVSGNDATYNATELDIVKLHIDGDEITINEAKGLQVPSGKAVYKQEDKNAPSTAVTVFKEGTYSSGSSASAKTLVISNLTATSFDYQIIESNGKDIITKGTAKILNEGVAECVFDDEYKITFNDAKNNVITVTESVQKLLDKGTVKFYTV